MNPAPVLARHGFSIGTGLFESTPGRRIVLPFRRSTIALLVIAALALVMTVPAVHAFRQAATSWGDLDGLFDLTTALFLTGWLLGWSTGLLILYGLLGLIGFGRETVVLWPGAMEIRLGLPFLFIRARLDPDRINNLHHHTPKPGAGTAWRGPHLAFDYDGRRLAAGSDLSPAEAEELASLIRTLPPGPAATASGYDVQATPSSARSARGQAHAPARTGPARVITRDRPLPVSTLALVAANLVPVVGVLLFNWDLGSLMMLFWAESGIVGLYNLLKLAVLQRWGIVFTGPFFLGHYGAFMAVHLLFVYELFVAPAPGADSSLAAVGEFMYTLWPALLALLLSHGLSFVYNFLGRGEYRDKTVREQMGEPYGRLVIMHVTVIIGGGLSLLLGSPAPALLLLVTLKIAADIRAHRQQHRLSHHQV